MSRSRVGVANPNWRGAEMREYVRAVQAGEVTGEPAPKLDYHAKIAAEKTFIEEHPNYGWLCEEARVRIRYYEKRLAEQEQNNVD